VHSKTDLSQLSLTHATFAATRHVLYALNTPKMRFQLRSAANAFLMYSEPRVRVRWLQMSYPRCMGELTALPQIL